MISIVHHHLLFVSTLAGWRNLLRKSSLFFLLLPLGFVGAEAGITQELTVEPYLQNGTDSSMVIVWHTDVASDSVVEYGLTEDFDQVITSSERVTVHHVKIQGLQPATEYHYRVRSGGLVLAEPSTFRTAEPDGDACFSFAIFGDSGSGGQTQYDIAGLIEPLGVRFLLHTGDLIYGDDPSLNAWKNRFFLPYASLLRKIPFYPSLANHEYGLDNARAYFENFNLPANNPSGTEKYYSFDYGNAHIMVLDGDTDHSPGSAQSEWLINELKHHRRTWNFVVHHYPPRASGDGGPPFPKEVAARNNLVPIFERYGVDIVFSGDHHDYERFHPLIGETIDAERGVIYIVSGGGGASLHEVIPGNLSAHAETVHHFIRIKIVGDELSGEAIRRDGTVADTFSRTARTWEPPLVAEDDLVLHLPFDECSGDTVQDRSSAGHVGFLGESFGPDVADPKWSNDSLSGCGALEFDSSQNDQYVTVPNTQGLFDPDQSFTLSAWVKYQSLTNWRTIVSGGDYEYAVYLSAGGIGAAYFRSLSPGASRTTRQVPANEWHHVVLTFDSGTSRIYMNGQLARESLHEGSFAGTVPFLRVGFDGFPGEGFTGLIDEVKVFRRALTAAEVTMAHRDSSPPLQFPATEPPPPPTPPVSVSHLACSLSFDEGGGQNAADGTDGNNDAVLGSSNAPERSDPLWTSCSKFGDGALELDGEDDLVTIPNASGDFDFGRIDWTIMAWIRPQSNTNWSPVFSGGDYEYALYLSAEERIHGYFNSLNPPGTMRSQRSLIVNQWNHLAVVKKGEGLLFYLNGERELVTTVTRGTIPAVQRLLVGHDGYPGDYFKGTIDEVKVYRHPLAQREIRSESVATFGSPYPDPPSGACGPSDPPPPPEAAPILLMDFEEQSGQSLADRSGNDWHGFRGSSPGADGDDPRWANGGGGGGLGYLEFEGPSDRATVLDQGGAADLDQQMTIMAWVRPASLLNWRAVFSGGDYHFALYVMGQGEIRGYFRNLDPPATLLTAPAVSVGTWTHVALTKSGSLVKLFVNGTERSSSTHIGSIPGIDRLRIGYDGYPGDGFRGGIDSVRVFGRALDASEILEHMNE